MLRLLKALSATTVLVISVSAAQAQVPISEQPPIQPRPVPVNANYRWHNGQWWYKMPSGQWKYWVDNQWVDFDPTTYRGPGLRAVGTAGSVPVNYDEKGFTPANPEYAGFFNSPGYQPVPTYSTPGYTGYYGAAPGYTGASGYYAPYGTAYGSYGTAYGPYGYGSYGAAYGPAWNYGYGPYNQRAATGGAVGSAIGGAVGGPRGAAVGGATGAVIGAQQK